MRNMYYKSDINIDLGMPNPRRPSKRPAGNKTISFCLSQSIDDDIEFEQKKREEYDFSGFQKLYESIISIPKDEKMSPEQVHQLRESLQYFLKLKSEITKKYCEAQEKYAKQVPSINEFQRKVDIRKQGIMRSFSTRVSFKPFQPTPQQQPIVVEQQATIDSSEKASRKFKKIAITPDSTISSSPSKQLSSMTLWNQENKFLGTIPTEAVLAPFLYPITMIHKRGQLGQHYSIKFNEKLRHKFKNDAVQIRVPLTLSSPSSQLQVSSEMIFHRMLSALVPLAKERSIERTSKTVEQQPGIIQNDEEIHPNAYGTSTYTAIPFEEKLILEIQSLGLNPDKSLPLQLDNEIARDYDDVNAEYMKSLETTNKMRENILKKLKQAEPELAIKAAKRKRHQQSTDKGDSQKKSSSKKKSRKQYDE